MFKIQITKITIEECFAGQEWLMGAGKDSKGYGYTPEIVKRKEVEHKIYEQVTDKLDIVKVIDAVNSITE